MSQLDINLGKPLNDTLGGIDFLNRIQQESQEYRTTQEPIWDSNLAYYLGQQQTHPIPAGLRFCTTNLVQGSVLSTAAIQTEGDGTRITISPKESSEPLEYYADATAFAPGFLEQSVGASPEQVSGQAPISTQQLMPLAPLMVSQTDPQTDQPAQTPDGQQVQPTIPEGALMPVDDKTRAEIIQAIFDEVTWERGSLDFRWMENIINKGVTGFSDMLLQWDFVNNAVEGINIHPKNVWVPPEGTDPTRFAYWMLAEPMSVQEATTHYPEWEKTILELGSTGPTRSSSYFQLGSPYAQINQRRMVTVWHVWLKYWPTPMSEDEALKAGAVSQAIRDTDNETSTTGGKDAVAGGEDTLVPTAPDAPAGPTHEPIAGTYVLPDGSLTAPDNDNWPTKKTTRQITLLGGGVNPTLNAAIPVEDIECPYDDVPIVRNINIPIPFRPDGQGEPERLRALQDAINRVNSILFNHTGYLQSPQMIMSAEVRTLNGDKTKKPFSHPGAAWIVPNEQMNMPNPPITFVQTPSLNVSYLNYLQWLVDIFKEVSGYSNESQGTTQPGVVAASAIQALQQAARTMVSLKARYTKRAMKTAAQIILGMIRDFLPDEEAVKIVSKYPPAMVVHVKNDPKTYECDINIELPGEGDSEAQKKQDVYDKVDRKMIDTQTALDKLHDPDVQIIMQRLQQQQAVEAQQAAASGENKSKPSQGSGK